MKLYETYPEAVEVGGRVYELNLDFRRVFRALDVQECTDFSPADKIELQLKLLLRDADDCPDSMRARLDVLNSIFELLPQGEANGEKYIDFEQDADMIRSAFYRIGVDLTRDEMHILQFLELLRDLPSDTALMRTIDIRSRPLPKPTKYNAEEIAAIQAAKAAVALKIKPEDMTRRFAESLKKAKF